MRGIVNNIFKWYLLERYGMIERFMSYPINAQNEVWDNLITSAEDTVFGSKYAFNKIQDRREYADNVPLQDYESLKPYIKRMMHGEKDVLWPGLVEWFSKSSGTTGDKSKFIPVSSQNLKKCHIRGSWDTLTLLYHNRPDSQIFAGKNLLMGGTLVSFDEYKNTKIGDVSAIMMANMPSFAKPFYAPNLEIGLMSEWEKKIDLTAHEALNLNITMLGGVPTWTIVLFRKLLEITGKSNILEVWPQFETYIHGGVSFTPYKEQFKEFLPSDAVNYVEIYNASEGYFAVQNDLTQDDMLLLLDNGVYYEFLPMEELEADHPKTLLLEEVELGKNYALVISTNAGLWRYMPGDTIVFTNLSPFKIKVSGRTQQFINAFGEEVMVSNTDKALAKTCKDHNAVVTEYTVAPHYFEKDGKGSHEWLVEFEKMPENLERFTLDLDKNLQSINSDYEAKRYKNMALEPLSIQVLPKGIFHNWMKKRGKFGGQHKIPRLANHRKYVEDILNFMNQSV